MKPETLRTMSVPEAGRIYFGLSVQGSYVAARRGDIPTIRVGTRMLRVPIDELEIMLAEAAQKARDMRTARADARTRDRSNAA